MTLTAEGRAIATEVDALNPELGHRMGAWLNRVRRMERAFDEICEDARQDELARADLLGQMRVRGGVA
jgi:hypothetical protein